MEKLKVLIVDDEIRICQLMKKLINWQTYNLELMGFVHDGIEAIEKIKIERPDIVLTDIRMPGCDGLEVVKAGKTGNSISKYIIISGYKHFDYAVSALKYGVVDYILKPINKNEINRILEKISKDIRLERGTYQKQMNAESRHKEKLLTIKRSYINNFVAGGKIAGNEKNSIDGVMKGENLKIYQAICLRISGLYKKEISDDQKQHLNKKLGQLLGHFFRNISDEQIIVNKASILIGVLNIPRPLEDMKELIYELLEESNKLLGSYGNYQCYISIGIDTHLFSEVSESIRTGILMSDNQRLNRVEKIMIYNESIINSSEFSISEEMYSRLKKAIYEESTADINQWLHSLFFNMREYKSSGIIDFRKEVSKVLACISEVSKEVGLVEMDYEILESEFQEMMNKVDTIEEIRHYILDIIIKYFDNLVSFRKAKEIMPIQIIKKYINDHYDKQPTLEEFAVQVELNPIYLSSLFKKHTGMTLTDYLIETRLEKAKELLKNTVLTISQISYEVGYKDSKYFSKLFRRKVGIKPNDYRKFYL